MATSISSRSKRRKVVSERNAILESIRRTSRVEASEIEQVTHQALQNSLEVSYVNFLNESELEIRSSDVESDSSDDELLAPANLVEKLAEWACRYNVTHWSLNSLLSILKFHVQIELPGCARSLLCTPRETQVRKLCGGEYVYFGLLDPITKRVRQGLKKTVYFPYVSNRFGNLENLLTLSVGCDGLPISRSNNNQFWPIMAVLNQSKNTSPFLVALYFGKTKPNNANEFLQDFVKEMEHLQQTGIKVDGVMFNVRISNFTADAPARSFLKYCKNHNAYFACEKCNEEGEWNGRVVLLGLDSSPRSDDTFARQLHEEHHTGESALLKLGIGMVSQFPIDYMHLICLGVMRKLLYSWVKGPLNVRIRSRNVTLISDALLELARYVPVDFNRKPRSLRELEHFKTTEFRMFLLYTGPVALKGILSPTMYTHFLLLSAGTSILLNSTAQTAEFNCVAQKLLKKFVADCVTIYGPEFITYNVHSLIHIAADSLNFGSLDNFSAFCFENYMQFLKKCVRGKKHSLLQVVNRVSEMEKVIDFASSNCSGAQTGYVAKSSYKAFTFNNVRISIHYGDNCFLTRDFRVLFVVGLVKAKEGILVCRFFNRREKVDGYPFDSRSLCIFKCWSLSSPSELSIEQLYKKCIAFPITNCKNNSFICFPLTYNIEA